MKNSAERKKIQRKKENTKKERKYVQLLNVGCALCF